MTIQRKDCCYRQQAISPKKMKLDLETFFNELLNEQNILPSNVEIVPDNAKSKSLKQFQFQRETREDGLYHAITRKHSNDDSDSGNERRTRWQRMKKQHSDSKLLRPMRRSSLLASSETEVPPLPPPSTSTITPPTVHSLSSNNSYVPPNTKHHASSKQQASSLRGRRGRWQKTARRQSDSRLFVPMRRGSIEMPSGSITASRSKTTSNARKTENQSSSMCIQRKG